MKYTVIFGLLGVGLVLLGAGHGGAWLLLLWPAVSLLVVASAYAKCGPSVFGKDGQGRLAWWSVIVLGPYLLFTWSIWHLLRLVQREDCCNEIIPRYWLGRRPLLHELPHDIDLVVDLTAEFFAAAGITRGRTYLCLPTLDAAAPDQGSFRAAVEQVAAWPGCVYIHCASGHGRSATFLAAVLMRQGLANNAAEALARIKQARPGIGLTRQQQLFLGAYPNRA